MEKPNRGKINLGRKGERIWNKAENLMNNVTVPERETVIIASSDSLFAEEREDIAFYSEELDIFKSAIEKAQTGKQMFTVIKNIGVPEVVIRDAVAASTYEGYDRNNFLKAIAVHANPRLFVKSKVILVNLGKKISSYPRYIMEENELYQSMLRDTSLSFKEVYDLYTNYLQETSDLLELQIEWIRERIDEQMKSDDSKESNESEESERSEEEVPFLLQDWDLSWTNNPWSMESRHLVGISTGSRDKTLEQISSVSLGEIMVKPGSILRALEFHLQKDIIQRALSARLSHVPDYMKDWVKIKRGRDRIFLTIPEEGKAIFFAANRDNIYRNI